MKVLMNSNSKCSFSLVLNSSKLISPNILENLYLLITTQSKIFINHTIQVMTLVAL
jgi:hypothetical protein